MVSGFRHRRRAIRRYPLRKRKDATAKWRAVLWQVHPFVLMIWVGLLFSMCAIQILEDRMRPMLVTVSEIQVQNAITTLLEQTVASNLEYREFSYDNMIAIQRDDDGNITALITDMARMNQFRNEMVGQLLLELEQLNENPIQVPMGSLIDSELFWGKGPRIKVKTFTVGTVSAEFESEFSSAGVNQTLHKIWLSLSIPVKILLPGAKVESEVDTQVCVAETVIVGQVPNYLQKAYQ